MPRIEGKSVLIQDPKDLFEQFEQRGLTYPQEEVTHRFQTSSGDNVFVTLSVDSHGIPTGIKEMTYPSSAGHELAGIVLEPFEHQNHKVEDGV